MIICLVSQPILALNSAIAPPSPPIMLCSSIVAISLCDLHALSTASSSSGLIVCKSMTEQLMPFCSNISATLREVCTILPVAIRATSSPLFSVIALPISKSKSSSYTIGTLRVFVSRMYVGDCLKATA